MSQSSSMSKEVTEDVAEPQEQQQTDYVEPPPGQLLDLGEFMQWSFYRALIAEFMATLLFLYITVATVIGASKQQTSCEGVGSLGIAWSFGSMIFLLVYCITGISGSQSRTLIPHSYFIHPRFSLTLELSGGHINPAVTFGLFLARKVSLGRALAYMVVQCLGAICGTGIVKGMMKNTFKAQGGGTNVVMSSYSKGTALGAEIIGTFVLLYAVFSAMDSKRKAHGSQVPVLAPLPIGLAVFAVHLATLPITGTGINPARSFGTAVLYDKEHVWDVQWIFWVGPFVGALAAAIFHEHVLKGTVVKALGTFGTNQPN